jgi:transposase
MSEARKKYSREFKTEAVRLISEGGHKVAKVARDLGVNETMLYRWRKEFGEDLIFPRFYGHAVKRPRWPSRIPPGR